MILIQFFDEDWYPVYCFDDSIDNGIIYYHIIAHELETNHYVIWRNDADNQ